ncbi:hypothetical protein UFOVP257_218 [uncultured Caudovirales phage]|uniref:Uncharacterized protein n=1 Tax=uncultured Caudovirales phage TaxID=2100421 RepID=A0A6J5LP47_9CAUD|nr:hypothetical protein UFOVP257_218 [uncultured Caudovirales phage]
MMRISEINQKPNARPEIFVDMDGVLADFFAEYAKLAGVEPDERGRHDYHNIPADLREPIIDKMRGTDFFLKLPKFPTADKLLEIVIKVFGHYNICSSPLRGDHDHSRAMKTKWIHKNLPIQPKRIVITPNKGRDAPAKQPDGTPNILIDDRNTVITQWEQSGGIGIKYQADEDGLDVVVIGLKNAMEIIRGKKQHTPQNIQSKEYGKMIANQNDQQVNEDVESGREQQILDFIDWCVGKLKISEKLPEIKFQDKKEGPDQHHTGYYDDQADIMWVYTGKRNLIDIMRTVAHELTHRKQHEGGRTYPGQSFPGSHIEQQADIMAGYLMKLYGKEHPEIIE